MAKTRLLTEEQERLREELRAALTDLDAIIAERVERPKIATSLRSHRGLNDFFLLVVVGEFIAGNRLSLRAIGLRLWRGCDAHYCSDHRGSLWRA